MPRFSGFSYRRRYNSLRLLGYDYNSVHQLCAITLVTDLRRPLFADINLAKAILTCLLSEQTLKRMRDDHDLHENLEYIAMNSVRAGYVRTDQFYPYTGFML